MRRLIWLPLIVPLLWFAGFVWFLAEIRRPPEPPPHADGIVVLTGGAERVAAGLRLLREGNAGQLLVSGVGHAAALRDLATSSGLDPAAFSELAERITLGRSAGSTHGNALETQAWASRLHITSLIVVTAGYHMPRALAELRGSLPDVVLIPYAVQPPGMRSAGRAIPAPAAWRLLAGEYSKFLAVELGLEELVERFSAATEHVG
jgi:uncharacterized SAM-binding protein YcdF (DUF218 family)